MSMSNYIDQRGKNGNGTLMPQTFIEEPISAKARVSSRDITRLIKSSVSLPRSPLHRVTTLCTSLRLR